MTRVDLAIDYYNTNLKVEPPKWSGTEEIEVLVSSNIIDGLTVMMTAAHRAGLYAHMNNGQFETLATLDDPEVGLNAK